MIIDACRPFDRLKTFPAVVRTGEAEANRLRDRWPGLFGADGKVRVEATHVEAPEREAVGSGESAGKG
jgi:hypothetical protein